LLYIDEGTGIVKLFNLKDFGKMGLNLQL